jgi:hypothetical protein
VASYLLVKYGKISFSLSRLLGFKFQYFFLLVGGFICRMYLDNKIRESK